MTDPLGVAFERMAGEFLAEHATLRFEWRDVRSRWWGDRRDLVFHPHSQGVPEVFVSLNDGQITVGAGDLHEDFEDFGRGLTDEEVARRAFARLLALLKEHRFVAE